MFLSFSEVKKIYFLRTQSGKILNITLEYSGRLQRPADHMQGRLSPSGMCRPGRSPPPSPALSQLPTSTLKHSPQHHTTHPWQQHTTTLHRITQPLSHATHNYYSQHHTTIIRNITQPILGSSTQPLFTASHNHYLQQHTTTLHSSTQPILGRPVWYSSQQIVCSIWQRLMMT